VGLGGRHRPIFDAHADGIVTALAMDGAAGRWGFSNAELLL